jgi:HEAT repeat protein
VFWIRPDVAKLTARSDVAGLVKVLRYRRSPDVRVAAVVALETLCDGRAIRPLSLALHDEEVSVRRAAAAALARMADPAVIEVLAPLLADEDVSVRVEAATGLAVLRDERGVELLAKLAAGAGAGAGADLAKTAATRLVLAKAPGETLARITNSRHPAAALVATFELAKRNDVRALESLVPRLARRNRAQVAQAALALRQVRGDRALEALLPLLAHPDDCVRAAAAQSLGEYDEPRSRNALLAALETASPQLRPAIERALGFEPRARKSEVWRLDSDAQELASRGPIAISLLVTWLSIAPYPVRQRIAVALLDFDWTPERPTDAAAFFAALGRWDECVSLGGFAFEPLVNALEAPWAKRVVDRPLNFSCGLSTCPVVIAAANGLGVLRDSRAVEPLGKALAEAWDSECVGPIARALLAIGDPRGVPWLLDGLRGNWKKRLAVAEALVGFYQSGLLDDDLKARILAVRSQIVEGHYDRMGWTRDPDDEEHEDRGIGVDFPI